jgi:hypothetical protein
MIPLNMLWHKPKLLILTTVLVVAMFSVAVLTSGLLSSQQSLPNTGSISSIGVNVYTNAGGTIPCTSIDWGTITPNSTTTHTIYIKNPGNTAETLTMTSSN